MPASLRTWKELRPHVDEFYSEVSGGRGPASIAYLANAIRCTESNRSKVSFGGAATSQTSLGKMPQHTQKMYQEKAGSEGAADKNGADDHREADNREKADNSEEELRDVELNEIRFMSAMAERRDEEIRRGVNLVGPHRDELALSLGTLPARGYASHGESWSYALALKLAAWQVLRGDESGEWAEGGEPILILDDVFAELDTRRRDRLAQIVQRAEQAIITAAVGSELPAELDGRRFMVAIGSITPEKDDG